MMMKAAPATALIVIEPDFLFQFFVIALNAPSAFGGGHQILERDVGRQEPVFGRLGFAVGPLRQEALPRAAPPARAPPGGPRPGAPVPRGGRGPPHAGKARARRGVGARAPRHAPP